MPNTEELLQELVTLQKEEMRRSQLERRLRFYLGTLPMLILLLLSVVSLWGLYEASKAALENVGDLNPADYLQYFQ